MATENRTGQFSALADIISPFKPTYLTEEDGLRVAAYQLYDDLYWNDTGGYRLTIRGDEEWPVYLPTFRRIVNTFNRYVARDPALLIETEDAEFKTAAELAFEALFKRERFWTKLQQEKINGSKRGDFILALFGNPDAPEGRRISISTIHPKNYLRIVNPDDKKDRWGALVWEIVRPAGQTKDFIRAQRWIKPQHPDHPNTGNLEAPVAYDSIIYEIEDWTDPAKRKQFQVVTALTVLDGIMALPIYHFKNNASEEDEYGNSDLKGLERIALDVNQTFTDESVAVAMGGLGMYVSDSQPVDDEGNDVNWILGPKRVVEVPREGKFDRVSGVGTVSPSQDHITFEQTQAQSVHGINDIAMGEVEVSVAESGIALALRMGPLLDAAALRDQEIADRLDQMFYDLARYWFPVYERLNFGDEVTGARVTVRWGEKLPEDRAGKLDRFQQLYTDRVIPLKIYWAALRELGFELPTDAEMVRLIREEQALGLIDPAGARLEAEAAGATSAEDDFEEDLTDGGPGA